MKVYDLSYPIYPGMQVFPGTPPVELSIANTLEKDGFRLGQLILNEHAGTHVDAPLHYLEDGHSIGEYELEVFVGPAVVIDLTGKKPREPITIADMEPFAARISQGSRVLLKTGWSKYSAEPEFYTDFPPITLELAKWFVDKQVALLGLEPPTLNSELHIEVHSTLLQGKVAVLEALNLDPIVSSDIFLVAAPLKVLQADGFPVRAFAIEF